MTTAHEAQDPSPIHLDPIEGNNARKVNELCDRYGVDAESLLVYGLASLIMATELSDERGIEYTMAVIAVDGSETILLPNPRQAREDGVI